MSSLVPTVSRLHVGLLLFLLNFSLGMFSKARESVLGCKITPKDTGDLAWRATISQDQIMKSHNAELIELTKEQRACGWVGPSSHVAFYPLRGGATYNLVLALVHLLTSRTHTLTRDQSAGRSSH
jgi:hypothetical protein